MAKNGSIGGGSRMGFGRGSGGGFGGIGGHGGYHGRGHMMGMMGMPNTHAAELSSMASYRSLSNGLTNVFENLRRVQQQARQVGEIYNRSISRKAIGNYGGLTGSLGNMIGMMKGPTGASLDISINKFLQKVRSAGGVNIRAGELSKEIANLKGEIAQISTKAGGFDKALLHDLFNKLARLEGQASKGGVGGIGGGVRGLFGSGFGMKTGQMFEATTKSLDTSFKNFGKWISDKRIKKSLDDIREEMERASSAAKTSYQRYRAIADTKGRLNKLAEQASGKDQDVLRGLVNVVDKGARETRKGIFQNALGRGSSAFNNRLLNITQAIGTTFSLMRPLKRTFDTANTVFQQLNNGFNRFASLQMRVTGERGAYGRKMRGAGMDFGSMMGALSAGRKAGMEDSQVIAQMTNLQTQLAQARWGEGGLIDAAGRWGLSVYDESGQVKQWDVLTAEVSKMANSMHDAQERLQFITHLGYRPEQMEYVLGFAKERQRMEFLKKNPHLQGTLDRANILDEEGWRAKADAYTKIELKRRQILNENAIEEGIGPALKRAFNPENWLLNDWTARQTGVRQARGEKALEKLEAAIRDNTKSIRENGGANIATIAGLSISDLASISDVARADIKNSGENSPYAMLDKAYRNTFGISFDVRTPIEKLQEALIPLTESIAKGVDKIISLLPGAVGAMTKHPVITGAAAIGGTALAVLGMRKLGGAVLAKASKGIEKSIGAGVGDALEKAGLGAAKTGTEAVSKTVSKTATKTFSATTLSSGLGSVAKDASGRIIIDTPTTTMSEAVRDVNNLAKSPASSLTGGLGKSIEKGFAEGAAKAGSEGTAKAVAKAGASGAAKSGLAKGVLGKAGIIGDVVLAGWGAKEAYDAYGRGDTAGAVRAGGTTVGGIAGGLAGGKLGAIIGGAIGTVILPGVGTAIGAALGGIGGSAAGFWGGSVGGGELSDFISNSFGLSGSQSDLLKKQGLKYGDNIADAEKAGEDFIRNLREALKRNETQRAMNLLISKGIHIDADELRNEKFLTDDTFANKTLQGAVYAENLYRYTAATGKSIGMNDFNLAMQKDKYINAANASGVDYGLADILNAVLRQTGYGGQAGATSYQMATNYLKNGYKNPDDIRKRMAEIAKEEPELGYSELKERANKEAKAEWNKNLTSADVDNFIEARAQNAQNWIDYSEVVRQAGTYGIDTEGRRRVNGKIVDDEGFLIDTNGNRVKDENGNDQQVGGKIKDNERDVRYRMQEMQKTNPELRKFSGNKRIIDDARDYLAKTQSEQRAIALKDMKEKYGLQITAKMMNEQERADDLYSFLEEDNSGMSMEGKIARYAAERGISYDTALGWLGEGGLRSIGGTRESLEKSSELYHQSGSYKAKLRAEERAKEKQKEKDDEKKQIDRATEEDLNSALKTKGEIDYYTYLKNKGERTKDEENTFGEMSKKVSRAVRDRERAEKIKSEKPETPWDTYDRGGELEKLELPEPEKVEFPTKIRKPKGGIGTGELGYVAVDRGGKKVVGDPSSGVGFYNEKNSSTYKWKPTSTIGGSEQIRLEGQGSSVGSAGFYNAQDSSTHRFKPSATIGGSEPIRLENTKTGDTYARMKAKIGNPEKTMVGEMGGNGPSGGIATTKWWNKVRADEQKRIDKEQRGQIDDVLYQTKMDMSVDAVDKKGNRISKKEWLKKREEKLRKLGYDKMDPSSTTGGFAKNRLEEELAVLGKQWDFMEKKGMLPGKAPGSKWEGKKGGNKDTEKGEKNESEKKPPTFNETLEKSKKAEQGAKQMNRNASAGAAAAASGAAAQGSVGQVAAPATPPPVTVNNHVTIEGNADEKTVEQMENKLSKTGSNTVNEVISRLIAAYNITNKSNGARSAT